MVFCELIESRVNFSVKYCELKDIRKYISWYKVYLEDGREVKSMRVVKKSCRVLELKVIDHESGKTDKVLLSRRCPEACTFDKYNTDKGEIVLVIKSPNTNDELYTKGDFYTYMKNKANLIISEENMSKKLEKFFTSHVWAMSTRYFRRFIQYIPKSETQLVKAMWEIRDYCKNCGFRIDIDKVERIIAKYES